MLNMERLTDHLKGEKQFTMLDFNPSGMTEDELEDVGRPLQLKVHPWARKQGRNRIRREVFISLESTDPNSEENDQNIIVDRDEFIEGILFAFPELCYNHDDEDAA